MSGARTLDEVIRWGSNELFAHYPDAPGGQQQEQAAAAEAATGQPAPQQLEAAGKDGSPGDVEMQDASAAGAAGVEAAGKEAERNLPPAAAAAGGSGALVAKPAVQPLSYSSGQVEQVLQKGAAACAAAAAAGSSDAGAAGGGDASVPSDLGLGLESVVVRLWPAVDKGVDHDCGECVLL